MARIVHSMTRWRQTYVVLFVLFICLMISDAAKPDNLEELKAAAEAKTKNHKNLIYFLHLHKAGGTTLCELAGKNGIRHPSANCLPEGSGGQGRNWVHFAKWDEGVQNDWAGKQKWGLVANEFTPIVHLPAPGAFTFITVIRDPLDRILSHFKYVKIWYPRFLNGKRNFVKPYSKKFPWSSFIAFLDDPQRDDVQTGEIENRVSVKHTIYPHNFGSHNFQTHMLTNCGRDCTEESLVMAKERLEYFSVVIVIERYAEMIHLLTTKLGWKKNPQNFKATGHQNTHSNTRQELAARPDLLETITAWNAQDLELYAFANELADKELGITK